MEEQKASDTNDQDLPPPSDKKRDKKMKDKLDKNKALKNLGTDINSEKDSADQASSSLVVVEQLS